MGLPTYEYPPLSYPMPVKYTNSGQCVHCGYKFVSQEHNFVCQMCSTKMHAGVEVNKNIYFHGDANSSTGLNDSNDNIREKLTMKKRLKTNLISIYVYPPKKFPMRATYLKRNGICVHCKNKILNSDKSLQCSMCKITFCCGIEFKNVVYYHGRILYSNDETYVNNINNSSSVIDLNLIIDTDSSVYFGKRFCQSKRCFIGLLTIIIVICILIAIFVYLMIRSF